ncbi:MAG: class I SAM-dependent methyltransferase [Microthrixaceae bacterium]
MTSVGELYERHVLPRVVELTCDNRGLEPWRQRALDGLEGRVVEIGFGSGSNVELYPEEVTHVHAVEPSDLAWRRAGTRIAELSRQRGDATVIDRTGLDGQSLPLDDATCDTALSTFTLCTVPDPGVALAELRRVLRPGGTLHVLEHGLAPDPEVARWQHRLDPLQRRIGGGCHLTRDVAALAADAGFDVELVDQRYVGRPRSYTWLTVARATRRD